MGAHLGSSAAASSFVSQARRLPFRLKAHLGSSFAALRPHLTPKYDPWTQRVCLDADGDFLATLRTGGASIVTCALTS